MKVELPDAPVAAAGLTAEEARLRLAFSLYREGRLSTLQCAELAGLSRRAFMDELARHRVEAPFTSADLEADLETLRKLEDA
jgi:predicted HTH domain antitoxin